MASANLPDANSSAPLPLSSRALNRWHFGILLLLTLASLLLVSKHDWTDFSTRAIAVLCMAVACLLWCFHLSAGMLCRNHAYPLAALLACQLILPSIYSSAIPASAWLGALGCGIFVYAMLWVAAVHECEPGLQPLATIALLLSIGVLAKPAVAIACAILSALSFFRSRRKFGGFLNSTLLLITPAMLCAFAFLALKALTTTAFRGTFPQAMTGHLSQNSGPLDLSMLIQESQSLWFSLAVLLSRFFERKTGISDVSYFILIAFLSTAGAAHWMPSALSQIDIQLIVYAGAACLLALSPPKRTYCLVLLYTGAAIPLLKLILL
jgi:hypothetical protein